MAGLTFRLGQLPDALQTDASNNVGIGGSPSGSYKLEVTGTSRVSGALTVSNNINQNINDGGINLYKSDGTTLKAVLGNLNGTTTDEGYLALYKTNSQTVQIRASGVSYFNGGNVGIGTGSPATLLDVRGEVSIAYNATYGLRFYNDARDNWSSIGNDITGSAAANLVFKTGGGTALTLNNSRAATFSSSITLSGNGTQANNTLFTLSNGYMYLDGNTNGLILENNNTSSTRIRLEAADNMQFQTASTERMRISSNGGINLNNFVYGNTVNTSPRTLYIESGTGSLGGISSIRASKKNIENVTNVDWLYQLKPVTFNYRKKDDEGNYTEEIHDYINYGLIAEDTAPIIDFIINYNEKEDGTKEMAGIEYPRLIIPMLKAIQELSAQNQDLKSRLDKAGL